MNLNRKGKPVVRRGRKVMGPMEEWDRQTAEIFCSAVFAY